jgi:hypothetical protein
VKVYDLVFTIKLSEDEVRITQNNDGVVRMWNFKDYDDPYHPIDELRYELDTLLESHVGVLIAYLKRLKAQEFVDKTKGALEGKPEQDEKYDWL